MPEVLSRMTVPAPLSEQEAARVAEIDEVNQRIDEIEPAISFEVNIPYEKWINQGYSVGDKISHNNKTLIHISWVNLDKSLIGSIINDNYQSRHNFGLDIFLIII